MTQILEHDEAFSKGELEGVRDVHADALVARRSGCVATHGVVTVASLDTLLDEDTLAKHVWVVRDALVVENTVEDISTAAAEH